MAEPFSTGLFQVSRIWVSPWGSLGVAVRTGASGAPTVRIRPISMGRDQGPGTPGAFTARTR